MKSKNIEHTWNTIRDFGMFTDRPIEMPAMGLGHQNIIII